MLAMMFWGSFRFLKQLSCESGSSCVRTSALRYFALVSKVSKQMTPLRGCPEEWKYSCPAAPNRSLSWLMCWSLSSTWPSREELLLVHMEVLEGLRGLEKVSAFGPVINFQWYPSKSYFPWLSPPYLVMQVNLQNVFYTLLLRIKATVIFVSAGLKCMPGQIHGGLFVCLF